MSGTATLERKGGTGPALTIPGLQHKAAVTVAPEMAPKGGLLEVDEEKGLVRAIVSVTGIVDNVNDRILPGAYTKTLKKRKPKGVWSHDWKDWVSRTEKIEEYLPGDSRLPAETKDGKPWPKEAGALVVETRFNMKSDRSREAFLAVEFFSETDECEWSIGYVVPPGQATKDKQGVRNIKGIDLFEYCPVLFGAASESMTLSVKSLEGAATGGAEAKVLLGLGGLGEIGVEEAMPDGSFRILTKGDVAGALRAYGRAADRAETKAHIVGRAVRVGAEDMLPAGWLADCQVKAEEALVDPVEEDDDTLTADEEALALEQADEPVDEADTAEAKALEVKYDTSPVGKPGGKENWVDKVGGLPKFIRAIAHALIRNGKSESSAIAIAVGTVKRWAAGEGKVSEKTKAKAAKALAEWEAKKAASHATKSAPVLDSLIVEPIEEKAAAYDPEIEAETKDGMPAIAVDTKMYGTPHLPGSDEARRQVLQEAVTLVLRGQVKTVKDSGYTRYEWDEVAITATFSDHVIATRYRWDSSPTLTESYSIDYTFDEASGTATLGTPEPVRLSVVTVVEETKSIEPVDGFIGLPDMLASVTEGVKAMVAVEPETKAGRVLSSANETRLRAAAEHLFAVLSAAGIPVVAPGDRKPTVDTTHDEIPDSTAPSTATGGQPLKAKTGEPEDMEGKVRMRMVDGRLVPVESGAVETKTAEPAAEPEPVVETKVADEPVRLKIDPRALAAGLRAAAAE